MSETYYRAEDVRRIIGDGFVLTKDGCEWTSKLFDQIPAADVVPVRSGRWEKYVEHDADWGDSCWDKCSLCGAQYSFGRVALYCPNCGAKMDLTDKAPVG